ncbi:hypothetical protein D915_001943 [Fasciola hepatica]|uniref:Ig-like domain-containing protein n=1 Tax=Fasciola hepatica TaxID=6192 RepID=A0A4E0S254_FASHE|nr:hypothetical protein D915_001943 [Fasciola hepatica]
MTYTIENGNVDIECPELDDDEPYSWTKNSAEIIEGTDYYSISDNTAELSIKSANQDNAGIFACLKQDGTPVKQFWVAVLSKCSNVFGFQDFRPSIRHDTFTVKKGDTIKLDCCLRYTEILTSKDWKEEYEVTDSFEKHFRVTSKFDIAELYDFNSASVGLFVCTGWLGSKKWERTFKVVEGPETIIHKPECHKSTWDIHSGHQLVYLIGSVKSDGLSLSYHPRMNGISTADRVNLQQSLVNYIGIVEYKPRVFKSSVKALGKVYKNNNPMEYAAEFNDPKSSEFAILKQQLTAYASELNLFHVNWFVPKERHIMQSSECELIAFDPEQNVVKTKLFGNNKELLRAGLVIQRNYPEFLSRETELKGNPFKYEIFKIEREESSKLDYQIAFIGGQLAEGIKKYAYGAQFEDPRLEAYRDLNRTVCTHIEKWRQNDVKFHTCPVYCTVYGIDSDSVVVTQLSIFNHHLVQADIDADENAALNEIASWLSRVEIRIGSVEYKPRVFKSFMVQTVEVTQYIPIKATRRQKLCDNIYVRIIDKKKSELLARECNVLDFDLKDSTITVSVKLLSDHVQYYGVDLDDLEVVWEE